MRTISSAHWNASLEAWREGEFSDEWKPFRHQAAMRGMTYPPSGSKWDSWDDDKPSQRAILVRAIRESPALLRHAIERSRTWNDVVRHLVRSRDDWRAQQALEERERDKPEYPTYREAVTTLKYILDRLGQS